MKKLYNTTLLNEISYIISTNFYMKRENFCH